MAKEGDSGARGEARGGRIAGLAALLLAAAALLAVAFVPPRERVAAPGGPGPARSDPPPFGASGAGLGGSRDVDIVDADAARSAAAPEKQRGVALGMFAEDASFDYGPLLGEIVALGASHVALVVPIYQEHGGSTTLSLHTRLSPTLDLVAETARAARRLGLEVTLFPIVRLAAPRGGEWRGTLRPDDVDAWFASYGSHLGDLAALGASVGATRLVVGSELSTLDGDVDRWTALLARVRRLFTGTLVYSANWDHYEDAKLLDLVDEAGVTAYFELRARGAAADVEALAARWRSLRGELERWLSSRKPQPFVFTEVGYRSRAGASAAPWDEGGGGDVDLEEQRRAFEAFRRAWAGAPSLAGIYVWNWYGYGGPTSTGYTPRGKPAAAAVEALLRGL